MSSSYPTLWDSSDDEIDVREYQYVSSVQKQLLGFFNFTTLLVPCSTYVFYYYQ